MGQTSICNSNQYLTFTLGNELFAADIAKVREVLDFPTITRVPRMPDYLLGVTNLRDNVVPVIDMRLKFGMTPTERTVDTCVVIVETELDGEQVTIGCLADSVEEVLDLPPDQIEPPPKIGLGLDTEFLKGMGKQGDKFLMILDMDKVLSIGELHLAKEAAAAEAASAERQQVEAAAEI
ncbi:MAG: chemotaxis protein CheW [bacterium]|nr:chemotaxis protein CheW [bacterium]